MELESEGDVLIHIEVREESIALEYRIHRTLMRRYIGDVLSVDEDFSLVCVAESGKQTEEGGLSAAGRTEKGEELSLLYIKAYVIKNTLFSEAFAYVLEFYDLIV
jgi:hypothetical protein